MKKTTTLELRDNLHLNKSRAECLLLVITALIRSGTACIWKFASCTNALALIASTYRRFQRFFRYVRIDPILLTRFILSILGMTHEKLILIFDRTNFKIGSKHVNLLVLAVAHQKMAVPIAWKTLPAEQKQSNSRVSDRWELLNRLIKAVGQQNILAVLGDREFLGKDWIQSLQAADIAYCMRLKESWQCIVQDQATLPLIKLLHSGEDTVQHLGFLSLGIHKSYITAVSAKRLSKHKALMLAHNIDIKNPRV